MTSATDDEGDSLACFEAWYEHGMPRLFNYIGYRVPDRATAEELTALVCERALTRLHQYDADKGSLDTWIFSIARHVICNHYRTVQRRPKIVALDDVPETQAQGCSPEESLEKIETFQKIMSRLRRLPEADQEVIALRYGADLSNQEVAHITGLAPNYVSVVLHRALKKLRRAVLFSEEV